jgi:hypothetical protein
VLLIDLVDKLVLDGATDRQCRVQVGMMLIPTPRHFLGQLTMAGKKCRLLADPALRLRMVEVAGLTKRNDIPEPVQLAVLTEQMLAAEFGWRYVLYPHKILCS